jgi:ABC-type molybdate transport system substrate-binding protein
MIRFKQDVRSSGGYVRRIETFATTDPIVYSIAITADSRHVTASRKFIGYLLGNDGQAVLATFGFERP